MASVNVKIPDDMENQIEEYLKTHPYYMNKSELVRDALRHIMGKEKLSKQVLEDMKVSEKQRKEGKTVTHGEIKEELDLD